MSRDSLGDRMKEYEDQFSQVIDPTDWMIIRLDGRAFHTFTKRMNRPFDDWLSRVMDDAAKELCSQADGARFAFLQSDECSVVIPPRRVNQPEHWLGGKTQKLASLSASIFTRAFNSDAAVLAEAMESWGLACFDARAFALPSVDEVKAYLCWRQADVRRNAISMIARSVFSHGQLHGKSIQDRVDMLQEEGVSIEDYGRYNTHGRIVYRDTYITDIRYFDKRTGEMVEIDGVTRSCWEVADAGEFREMQPTTPEELVDAVIPGSEQPSSASDQQSAAG